MNLQATCTNMLGVCFIHTRSYHISYQVLHRFSISTGSASLSNEATHPIQFLALRHAPTFKRAHHTTTFTLKHANRRRPTRPAS